MLSTLVLNRESKTFTTVSDPREIHSLCALASNILWVDVADPSSRDFDELAREFGFHPLAIEDCKNGHQRPKVDEYQGYYFSKPVPADQLAVKLPKRGDSIK